MGDSFTFGELVNDHETWPAILEEISGHRVINGGVFNFGLDQIYLWGEELVARYQPDLTIISFIPDDISRCGQSVRGQAKPYFSLNGGELTLENVPVPQPPGTETLREMDFFRRVFGYSYLVDFVMRRVGVHYWLNHPIALTYDDGRQGAGTNPGTEIACALMERFATWGEVLVVAQYPQRVEPRSRKEAVTVLGCAAAQGLPTLDLFEPLQRVRKEDPKGYERLYWGHMSAKGNRFVADKILNEVSRHF